MRTRVWMAAAAACVAALGAACGPPPDGPPPTTVPGLPVAPRLQVPASLGAGAQVVVLHQAPGGSANVATLADAGSDRALNLLDDTDAELLAAATGRVDPNTGAALMEPEGGIVIGPGAHPYRLCDSWNADNCRDVPSWSYVKRIGFSPDGTMFATVEANEDSTGDVLRIFAVDDLSLVTQAASSHLAQALGIAWSPDSSAVALTVPPGDDGAPIFEAAVATLAATPGSTPQVVVPSAAGVALFGVAGWSTTGRLVYRAANIPSPDDPQPTVPPPLELRSVAADASDAPRTLAVVQPISTDVVLPDGSVLFSAALPGGTPSSPHGVVVHHVTDTAAPVVTQLATPATAVVGGTPAWSTTLVLGVAPST